MQVCRESTIYNGDGIDGTTSTIAGGAKDNDTVTVVPSP